MPEISLMAVLIVSAIAFLVPLGLGLIPALRIPSVVLEIVAGILIGPAVLGLVEVDLPLQVLALLGLAFLLLLAGGASDPRRAWGAGAGGAAARFPVPSAGCVGRGPGGFCGGGARVGWG